jgi:hypothetical protein
VIAGRLTMRAHVERNVAAGTDAWGQPVAPNYQPHGNPLPCFVWSPGAREIHDGDKNAQLTELRGLFALGADLNENDEIAQVTDRVGKVLWFGGRLKVEGPVQFKHTHLEAALRRIS